MKRPIIIVTTSAIKSGQLENLIGDNDIFYSDKITAETIIQAGGIPLYIPSVDTIKQSDIENIFSLASGVLLTGADTITNPKYYREKLIHQNDRIDNIRDKIDMKITKLAYKKNIPLLAICKGMQVANVALGGSLYQDITQQTHTTINHNVRGKRDSFTHTAKLEEKSILKKIFKADFIELNGGHSQGIKSLSEKLQATAISSDGIIEAYQAKNKEFFVGIQFHAELLKKNAAYFQIFKEFMTVCSTTSPSPRQKKVISW